jgi:hypothetical protein
MLITVKIGRYIVWDKWNEMIMNTTGRGKSLGSGKNNLVFGYERLEVIMHKQCPNFLNRMELGDNT